MRIDRKAITDEILPNILLLKPENERFLKWERLVFGGNGTSFQDDFPLRIPLSILFIVLLLLSFPNFLFQAWRYYVYSTQGVNAVEELVELETASLGRRNFYYMTYRYSYGTEQYTKTLDADWVDYRHAEIGSRREVILVPSNSDLVISSLDEVFNVYLYFLILVVSILTLYAYCLWRWYRKIWLVPAKIIEIEQGEKHTSRGVHAIYELLYELSAPKTKTLLKGRASIPASQDTPRSEQFLAVLYLNDEDFLPL
jgi:hypothetical protein